MRGDYSHRQAEQVWYASSKTLASTTREVPPSLLHRHDPQDVDLRRQVTIPVTWPDMTAH